MKNKPICFMLLATLFPFSAYAFEITEETLTVTPGCEGGISYSETESWFLTSIEDLNVLFPGLIDKECFEYSAAIAGCSSSPEARTYAVDGYANSNIKLTSDHVYYLCNNSNSKRQFRIYIKLSTHDNHSTEQQESITLKPMESARGSRKLYFKKSYSTPGSYKIHALTEISVSSSSAAEDTARATIR